MRVRGGAAIHNDPLRGRELAAMQGHACVIKAARTEETLGRVFARVRGTCVYVYARVCGIHVVGVYMCEYVVAPFNNPPVCV